MQLICKYEIRKHARPEKPELLVSIFKARAINCIGPVVLEGIIIIPSAFFTPFPYTTIHKIHQG